MGGLLVPECRCFINITLRRTYMSTRKDDRYGCITMAELEINMMGNRKF